MRILCYNNRPGRLMLLAASLKNRGKVKLFPPLKLGTKLSCLGILRNKKLTGTCLVRTSTSL